MKKWIVASCLFCCLVLNVNIVEAGAPNLRAGLSYNTYQENEFAQDRGSDGEANGLGFNLGLEVEDEDLIFGVEGEYMKVVYDDLYNENTEIKASNIGLLF